MVTLPATTERVAASTPQRFNLQIERETQQRLHYYQRNPHLIPQRLEELDREWDIERILELNASALALTGVALGVFVDRRFLILPAVVLSFLMQHAIQGWCPPVPILRAKGVRTQSEIERERCELLEFQGRAW